LDVDARSEPEGIRLRVQATGEGDWEQTRRIVVDVREPSGQWKRLEAKPEAPGYYAVQVPAPATGRYDLRVALGTSTARAAIWHEPKQELTQRSSAELAGLTDQGLIRPWSPREGDMEPPARGQRAREPWIALALFAYLLALFLERSPFRRASLVTAPERP
jgi:hypothetical protein